MKRNKKSQQEQVSKDYTLHIVASLIVISIILRFYHLDFNSIWLDEAATYFHSGSLSDIFDYYNTSIDPFNPPLFFLFEFIMIKIAGASEIGLRFFPALFGVLTIPAAYLMGKEFHDKYTGIVTAAIFTFSPFLIYYSQEARAFSLLLLLCVALTYVFLKALKSNTRKEWIHFGILSAIIFCTHFYGVVFVALLAVFAAVQLRSNIKSLLYGLGVGLFFSLPLIFLTSWLYFQRTASGAPTYGLRGIDVFVSTMVSLAGFVEGYIAMLFLLLATAGIIWLLFKDSIRAYLLLWIIVPTFIIGFVMSSHIPILPRYMIFLMIPVSLGIASLYEPIAKLTSSNTRHLQLCLLFIVAFALMAVPFYQTYYTSYYKEDWRGLSKDMETFAAPGDIIVPLPWYLDIPIKVYYNASEHGTNISIIKNLSALQNSTNPDPTKSTYYIITYDIVAEDPSLEMLKWFGNFRMSSKYGNMVVIKK
jgi:mannosyltransferase